MKLYVTFDIVGNSGVESCISGESMDWIPKYHILGSVSDWESAYVNNCVFLSWVRKNGAGLDRTWYHDSFEFEEKLALRMIWSGYLSQP